MTVQEVYERFGRAAEVCQFLETEVGTALLALDAIETQSFLNPDADKYLRLRSAIEKQTLGTSLKKMREKLHLMDDLDMILTQALDSRNYLMHRFFCEHQLQMLDDDGRNEMSAQLDEKTATLFRAYVIAGNVAQALVTAVSNMKTHVSIGTSSSPNAEK